MTTEELNCPTCFVPVSRDSARKASCPKCGDWWLDKDNLHQILFTTAEIRRMEMIKWQIKNRIISVGPEERPSQP
jgi:Zn-finger nucleic acid-binding protein